MTNQTTPEPLSPEMVNAIVRDMDDPRFPARITVFCDHCGVEDTGEYLVHEGMTRTERLAVARKHLVESKGWEHTAEGDDFCPTHASPSARGQGTAACAKCKTPFDPTDTRFDGTGRYAQTPYCGRCVDACHESTDAFHRCAICA